MNINPGGRSTRAAPVLPSAVPFTAAEKVSTTTAGREFWGGAEVSVSRQCSWRAGTTGRGRGV